LCAKGIWQGGDHGISIVSDGPAMSYSSMPYGWATLRGGLPAEGVACGCLLPLWTFHAVRLCLSFKLHALPSGFRISCWNESKMGLNSESVSGICQTHTYSMLCGQPSLDRAIDRFRDGCPQAVITNYKMIVNHILMISSNPKVN
jgi:hypothetical protein